MKTACAPLFLLLLVVNLSVPVAARGDDYYIAYYDSNTAPQDRLALVTDFAQRGAGSEFWDHVLSDLHGRRVYAAGGNEELLNQKILGIVLAQYSPDKPSSRLDDIFTIARTATNVDLKTMAVYALRSADYKVAHDWVADTLFMLAMAPGDDPAGNAQVAAACIATLYHATVPLADSALMMAASESNWFPDSVRERASAVIAMRAEGR